MTLYRQEHPNPQFMRKNWTNLNGEWQFEQDFSQSGTDRKWFEVGFDFSKKINVPFCPESELSGVGFKDFMPCVWYKRKILIDKDQCNDIIRLHIGACDYRAVLYINGKEVGEHKGGYVSFFFDVQDYLQEGENEICIAAYDDTRSDKIPSGKQDYKLYSHACLYTRTTGIWQTVWLEFIPKTHIEKVKYTPNGKAGILTIDADLCGKGTFHAVAYFEGKKVGETSFSSDGGRVSCCLPVNEIHLWEVGEGNLYDLTLSYGEDEVQSYFGLRDICFDGCKFILNGKSVFQRLVLDQGYYPDGIYTAPSDEALKKDILLSQAVGFNGARLHEKIFEERFLYHCDKLGYLVWAEYPNWGISHEDSALFIVLPEWLEEIERDYNHPSIIGWCPINETRPDLGLNVPSHDRLIQTIFDITKAVDPTRPCIDVSGHSHAHPKTDIYDIHTYQQDPQLLAKAFENLGTDGTFTDWVNGDKRRNACFQKGKPFFVSEYGGTVWSNENDSWGYGQLKTKEEFLAKVKALTDVLLDNPFMFGFCYTQLYDVELERNGIYTYGREEKFPTEEFYKIFSRKAAIED